MGSLDSFSCVDRFEVLRCIGSGGMGTVYEAHDRERNVRVALKTLRSMNAESLLRFKTEFRDFQHLRHPNIVSVGELFSDGTDWYFSMELIDGVSFLEYVRRQDPECAVEDDPPTRRLGDHRTWAVDLGGLVGNPHLAASGIRRTVLDEARTRSALRQLAEGLHALHGAHKIHCDIKPSNVLVAQDGRVVLLDFGLASDLDEREHKAAVEIVGTVEYMAPEQAAGRQVGPPADWYGVGVVLYEALTGQLPFSGSAMDILVDKQRREPAPPRTIDPGVPPDLDALCRELLQFNPAARPSGEQVLAQLGVATTSSPSAALSSFSGGGLFVGRDRELQQLRDSMERSNDHDVQIVALRGESGVGKTALVRRFVSLATARDPSVVVLHGTCFERESLPFKAVDGVIDSLSQYMRRLPKAEAAALLPRQAALLAQVFPVLRRVEAVADAPRVVDDALDPHELRRRLFAAIRELLQRIADRRPLVISVDDLQWADSDSLALLSEVLRPPEAPRLLLVATIRTSHDRDETVPLAATRTITLERLSPSEGRELAQSLLAEARLPVGLKAHQIAREAAGHPLFIDELIRHACTTGAAIEGPLQLDDALWARIVRLDREARTVLELVCLAGGRLEQQTAAQAAGLDFGTFAQQVAALRVAHLVRTTGMRATDSAEPYHGRIRAAVLAHIDAELAVNHHRRLALAHETSGKDDPEPLATHWREAGDLDKAARFATMAAERADHVLAFERAVHFYQLALELTAPSSNPVELWRKLGDALSNAGRGGEAGEAYLRAAAGRRPEQAIELRRRAAEQLLVSGHIDRGLAVLHEVLATVDMHLAGTPRRALLSLVISRSQVRLRGLRFRERAAAQISPDELSRIDICWSASIALALVDSIRGADFQARNLLHSLRVGEPYRVARALATEAAFSALGGGTTVARTTRLTNEAVALAARVGDPHAIGLADLMSCIAAFLQGRWRAARDHAEAATKVFRGRCTGVTWELDTAQLYPLWAGIFLGDVKGLGDRAAALLANARSRGDRYLETNLRTRVLNVAWLAADRPDLARREVEAGIAQWSLGGFHLQNYFALHSLVEIDLYAGDAERALARLDTAWPVVSRSGFVLAQLMRIETLYLRARCELAVARISPGSAARLRASAERGAHKIAREHRPWSDPFVELIGAAIADARGDAAAVEARLGAAIAGFERADMTMHAMCARRQLGDRTADAWLVQVGVHDPPRMSALLVSGFG